MKDRCRAFFARPPRRAGGTGPGLAARAAHGTDPEPGPRFRAAHGARSGDPVDRPSISEAELPERVLGSAGGPRPERVGTVSRPARPASRRGRGVSPLGGNSPHALFFFPSPLFSSRSHRRLPVFHRPKWRLAGSGWSRPRASRSGCPPRGRGYRSGRIQRVHCPRSVRSVPRPGRRRDASSRPGRKGPGRADGPEGAAAVPGRGRSPPGRSRPERTPEALFLPAIRLGRRSPAPCVGSLAGARSVP